MRMERRGRVIRALLVVNRGDTGGASERAEAKAEEVLRYFQVGRRDGLREGEGQRGRSRRRRGVDPALRGEPEEEPLQALESHVLGDLLPASGARRGDPEESGWCSDS